MYAAIWRPAASIRRGLLYADFIFLMGGWTCSEIKQPVSAVLVAMAVAETYV